MATEYEKTNTGDWFSSIWYHLGGKDDIGLSLSRLYQ